MKCLDDKIHGMIPDFASGNLSPEEQSMVDQHLATGCASCQELLEQVRWLTSGLKKYAREETKRHVSSESLIAYADDQGPMSREARKCIEAHIVVCEQCQSEIELLRSLDDQLASVSKTNRLEAESFLVDLRVKVQGLWSILRKPAVAYSVAAAAVIVMMSTITNFHPSLRSSLQTEQVTVLSEQVRGATTRVPLYRDSRQPIVRLGIASFWPDTGLYSYRVSVENDSGRTFVTANDFREFGEMGFTQFILNTSELPDGSYRFHIRAQDKQDSVSALDTFFPFELKEK